MSEGEFVMPDPKQQGSLEDKMNRQDQLNDAVDAFESAPTNSVACIAMYVATGAVLLFAFWSLFAH